MRSNNTLKLDRYILGASVITLLFFTWIYVTYIFQIEWTIAGVIHELLMIPMILVAPILLFLSIRQVKKSGFNASNTASLIISCLITIVITSLFVAEFLLH